MGHPCAWTNSASQSSGRCGPRSSMSSSRWPPTRRPVGVHWDFASQDAEIERNAALRHAPTHPRSAATPACCTTPSMSNRSRRGSCARPSQAGRRLRAVRITPRRRRRARLPAVRGFGAAGTAHARGAMAPAARADAGPDGGKRVGCRPALGILCGTWKVSRRGPSRGSRRTSRWQAHRGQPFQQGTQGSTRASLGHNEIRAHDAAAVATVARRAGLIRASRQQLDRGRVRLTAPLRDPQCSLAFASCRIGTRSSRQVHGSPMTAATLVIQATSSRPARTRGRHRKQSSRRWVSTSNRMVVGTAAAGLLAAMCLLIDLAVKSGQDAPGVGGGRSAGLGADRGRAR